MTSLSPEGGEGRGGLGSFPEAPGWSWGEVISGGGDKASRHLCQDMWGNGSILGLLERVERGQNVERFAHV